VAGGRRGAKAMEIKRSAIPFFNDIAENLHHSHRLLLCESIVL
jgi:hypothetical protein